MSVEISMGEDTFGSELISRQLGAARDALMESQRKLPRGSVAWRAARVLIREIDSLVPVVTRGRTRSATLNLNAPSESQITGRGEGAGIGWSAGAVAMSDGSLERFAEQVLKKDRIGKYDVQALRRDILVEGITSRAEAEFLIALDRKVASVHFSWSAFFITAMTEFVVWRSGEAGHIDQDKSTWLQSTLAGEGSTDRAKRALLAIAREAECFHEAFFSVPATPHGPGSTNTPVEQLGLAA